MSLTEKGYRERTWGPFPVLRKAIEGKEILDNYYGLTSASDNKFEAMHRLIEIAALVQEYKSDIKETALSVGRGEMRQDLENLMDELKRASKFFEYTIDKVRTIYDTL